jgi:hypothetical protein
MMRAFIVVVVFALSVQSGSVYAWPSIGLSAVTGSWQGCQDGESVDLLIQSGGFVRMTAPNDQDLIHTYCDAYKRSGKMRYLSESIVLLCPSVDSSGQVDPTTINPLYIKPLDENRLTLRVDLNDSTEAIFRRTTVPGQPAPSCTRGTAIHHLIAKLKSAGF